MGAFIELFAKDISYFSKWVNKETEGGREQVWEQAAKGYQNMQVVDFAAITPKEFST